MLAPRCGQPDTLLSSAAFVGGKTFHCQASFSEEMLAHFINVVHVSGPFVQQDCKELQHGHSFIIYISRSITRGTKRGCYIIKCIPGLPCQLLPSCCTGWNNIASRVSVEHRQSCGSFTTNRSWYFVGRYVFWSTGQYQKLSTGALM